ncbi:MAG: 3-dehydroquinate synthase, partial [Enterococcus faecium]|nr:3-dehydroquinate synthase [Enterococcus faecium]
SHGEGVAIGMVAITSHAEKIGLSPTGSTAALERILQKFHLPITYDLSHSEELFHAITHDKKARGSQLNIILLEKIGQAKIVPVPTETFKDYLGGL